jgi:hypothetical protein
MRWWRAQPWRCCAARRASLRSRRLTAACACWARSCLRVCASSPSASRVGHGLMTPQGVGGNGSGGTRKTSRMRTKPSVYGSCPGRQRQRSLLQEASCRMASCHNSSDAMHACMHPLLLALAARCWDNWGLGAVWHHHTVAAGACHLHFYAQESPTAPTERRAAVLLVSSTVTRSPARPARQAPA